MTIQKRIGERSYFTGGAEDTPLVEVSTFRCPGSMHHGDKNLLIQQGNSRVSLSLETLKSMIEWAETKD